MSKERISMDKNFCIGCPEVKDMPKCIIQNIPSNSYIEDIIENSELKYSEYFICHKFAQGFENNKLVITPACDDCGLCQIACCKKTPAAITSLFNRKLESVLFRDLGKASILFQSLFPSAIVASEVQVKGNFRTKRIDLVIFLNKTAYLIKLIKNLEKIPFYSRSYGEVIDTYNKLYPNINFTYGNLIPTSKLNVKLPFDAQTYDLEQLFIKVGW
ncbi:hypothetical protein [Haloimpatiens lingqiaonensis]|uniref:hypothetical protein n=1 Tax=Haloimpatiens lingqiaonensis TaxID=1380675 RepID=UPI0037BEC600